MRTESQREYVEYVSARLVPLRQLAYLLCGDEHRADDLVQQTITKLYVKWRRVSGITHLDQYVRTMLVRTFIDEKRRAWSRVGLFADAPEPTAPAEASVEDRIVLRAALSQVPRRQQAVLVLRFLCDQSVEEVAETLNCSTGTVKSQTSRGLHALRRLMSGQELVTLRRDG
jgi:RNA polymerase sigma-70 factor (sigma-E family)